MGNPALDQLSAHIFSIVGAAVILLGFGGFVLRALLDSRDRCAGRLGKARRARTRAEAASQRPPPKVVLPHVRSHKTAIAGEASLDTIGWGNFELLAAELYRRQGWEVEVAAGLGADGGKDVILRRDGQSRLVQCKNLRAGNKVSVGQIREFYGLIVAESAAAGIFMTTGSYSRDAREFAEGKPIELLERSDIEAMIRSVARAGENLCDVASWIDNFAATANVADPTCPLCRKSMKLRRGPTGSLFWGCTGYPTHRCRGKRDVRAELMRARSYRPA